MLLSTWFRALRVTVPVVSVWCSPACFTPNAVAQAVVRGELFSVGDQKPLQGALVVLVDSAGRTQSRWITDSAGRFQLSAASPGRYRLEAQLIGYELATSPLLTVGAAGLTYRFEIRVRPVQLPTVEATAGGRGCPRRADGAVAELLWNEVRKALHAADWTLQFGDLDHVGRMYRMEVDPRRRLLLAEERSTAAARSRLPFVTAEPSELAARGFSRMDGAHLVLLAPDASVLVSDEFLAGHCFRLEAQAAAPQFIGLSFEPIRRRRGITDVSGTLWVDRQTGALRTLEYRYTNLPDPVADYGAHGTLRFLQLQTGHWIVESWQISSPLLTTAGYDRHGFPQFTHRGWTEDGGVVLRTLQHHRPLYEARVGSAAVEGVVRNELGNSVLPGARVFLTGMEYEALTDADGRYRIDGVRAGRYGISFTHGLTADLRLPVALDSIDIGAAEIAYHDLMVPAIEDVLRTLCPGEQEERVARGLIYGVVTDTTGAPLPHARFRASWRGPPPGGGGTIDRWREGAGSDHEGRFYLCWMPIGIPVTVEGRSGRLTRLATVTIDPHDMPILRLDFTGERGMR